MKEKKFKVKNLYFGDLVMVLDYKVVKSNWGDFKIPIEVEELEKDIVFCPSDIHEYYNFNNNNYYCAMNQGFLIDLGDIVIRDYDLCLNEFVSQYKITRVELKTVQNNIINSNQYQKIKSLKKKAYINSNYRDAYK